MLKLLAAPLVVLASLTGWLAACDPPPEKIILGDSEPGLVAPLLPEAVDHTAGGSTVCDTAYGTLPPAGSKVLIGVGGQSWALNGEAAAHSCLNSIVTHYSGLTVYVALPPVPLAIACGNGAAMNLTLDASGIPHGDLTVNPDYELRQRIEDFATWEAGPFHAAHPGVILVDWRGDEHYGLPDCAHLDPYGAATAATQTRAAGF